MLYFLFCIFTDKKQQSRVFETGLVGLEEAQLAIFVFTPYFY